MESSRVAAETYLAMRRGAHILPKYMFGMPTDHLTDSPLARGPLFLQKLGMKAMLRISTGKLSDYGLPQPDHASFDPLPWAAGTPEVLVTEKDAVKLAGRVPAGTRAWVVTLDFGLPAGLDDALRAALARTATPTRSTETAP